MTRSGRLLLSILGAFAIATAGVPSAAAAPLEPGANLPAVQATAPDAAPAAGQVATTHGPADCAPTTIPGTPCDPVGPTSGSVSPNVAWSVGLEASATGVPLGATVNLTATANQTVSGTSYYIVIMDGATVVHYCGSGTYCFLQVTSATATIRSYTAVISADQYGGTSPQATSDTIAVTWSWVTISGTVTNASAVGLSGIAVWACVPPTGTPCEKTTSSAGGVYTIGVVAYTTYNIDFMDLSGTYWYNSLTNVAVVGDSLTGKDVTLQVIPPWTVTLAADATPVLPGTNVTLTATANQSTWNSPFSIDILDGNGTVVHSCTDATTCSWVVTSATAASVPYRAVIAHTDGSSPQATSSTVTVTWLATISGTVTNASAVPLAGILAKACAGATCYTTQTAADGTYSLAVPPNATYNMSFADPSGTYFNGYRNGVVVGTSPVTGIDATLSLIPPWTVTLEASATSVLTGTPVTLTATANQDVGPTNFYIRILDGNGSVVASCGSGTTCAKTVTSPTPTSRSYRAVIARIDGSSEQATSSTVTVVWMATISGTVRNGAAAGLANITVYVCIPGCAGGPRYHTTTVSGGTYSIAVAPGSYTLMFADGSKTYGSGWYSTSGFTYDGNSASPVDVTSSNASGIDVTLPAAVHIKGTVTNAAGAALPGIAVGVYFSDALPYGGTTTLGDGTYSFVVAPGSFLIKFSDASGTYATGWYSTAGFTYAQSAASPVSVTSSDATGIDVTLPLAGATYVPLTPTRLLDTRNGTGLSGAFSSHVARTFQVTGGVVPASATAVTGNLTVTQQTSGGFLYIGPVAMNDPTSSTLNFPLGDDRANAVTVALGAGGTLSVTYAAGTLGPTAQVIFDVTGYFVADTSGATYHALTPARILDSRDHTGGLGIFSSHVAQTFQVSGAGGVPANATAVTGNLTVTQQTSGGFLFVGPVAMNNPTSSTLNFPVGDDRANAVTVALGAGGTLSVTYAAGTLGPTAQVIFDVTGYFTPDMSGATYHTLTPTRILDTRSNTGLTGPSSSHVARPFQVTGGVVLSGAAAVTGNLTVTQQTAGGFLYIGPVAMNDPTSSTLNFPLGDDRANAVTVALGAGGTLSVTYAASTLGPTAQVIFDVTGYFAP